MLIRIEPNPNGTKLTQMNGERAPLSGAGVEVAIARTIHLLNVQVPSAHSLRAKAIEQRYVGSTLYAH